MRGTPQHPAGERDAVAAIGGAPHTVCDPRLSALQAALTQAGFSPRSGKPQRQHE